MVGVHVGRSRAVCALDSANDYILASKMPVIKHFCDYRLYSCMGGHFKCKVDDSKCKMFIGH